MRSQFPAIVIDPSNLFREGLARLLVGHSFTVEASVSRFSDLDLENATDPAAFILGGDVPSCGLCEQIGEIRRRCSAAKIVIIGSVADTDRIRNAFVAGADGYVDRSGTLAGLIKSLEIVIQGGVALPREIIAALAADAMPQASTAVAASPRPVSRMDILSNRESRVLRCLLDGESNKHIARRYAMAESTVKVHVKSIFRKIGAKNRTQAAIWAMNHSDLMQSANA